MTGAEVVVTWRRWCERLEAEAGGRAQARWMCEEASGSFGGEFDEVLDAEPNQRMLAHLEAMRTRLRAGEPLQYVLGHWSFRRLDVMIDRRVLIPRPETELVAGAAIEAVHGVRAVDDHVVRCADLGTGSGAIGLSIAFELPRGTTEVWLTDVSPDALDVARANAAGLGIAGGGVRFALGTWFAALPDDMRGSFDVIVSNPPYVALGDAIDDVVRDWEPVGALYSGPDGLDDIRAVVGGAAAWLRVGGTLVLEIGATQADAVRALLAGAGFSGIEIRKDLAGRDRIAIATR